MNKHFSVCLLVCAAFFYNILAAAPIEVIYIVGVNGSQEGGYWSVPTSNSVNSFQALDTRSYVYTFPHGVAFSQDDIAYMAGDAENEDLSAAAYWTVSRSGNPSSMEVLERSEDYSPTVRAIAFSPSGNGYLVGRGGSGNPAFWVVSPSGTVSDPTELPGAGFVSCVAFASTGVGYIGGVDSANNAAYWTISPSGVVSGPIGLVGGEAGGVGSVYAIATSPWGTTYLVGSTTDGQACYWVISNSDVVNSAVVLAGGSNSMARGIAFVPGDEGFESAGIIVGQTAGNVASYWFLSSEGAASPAYTLPNGSGFGSIAYGVAFTFDVTAYIVGMNSTNEAVYWTLPFSNPVPETHLLDGGANGIAMAIAIYSGLDPDPPTHLSGRYVINNFGWIYERCAIINWVLSDSSEVVAYNIYRDDVKIATVSGSTTQYGDHNRNDSRSTYAITAIDSSGHESDQATITIN